MAAHNIIHKYIRLCCIIMHVPIASTFDSVNVQWIVTHFMQACRLSFPDAGHSIHASVEGSGRMSS